MAIAELAAKNPEMDAILKQAMNIGKSLGITHDHVDSGTREVVVQVDKALLKATEKAAEALKVASNANVRGKEA